VLSKLSAIVETNNYVVLDTETTGLRRPAEIVQIAIVDHRGDTLLNTLLHPLDSIPPEATAIHGITDEMCLQSPTWPKVKLDVMRIIAGKSVLVYNAKYDRHMMHCSDEKWGMPPTDYHENSEWFCMMELYAEYHGEIHPYYGTPVWQKLTAAMQQMNLPVLKAHGAEADCLMTLSLAHLLTAIPF